MHELHADRVTLAYDTKAIVNNLSITVPTGKITALIGPNGCGKSTLLRGLARLLRPRAGAVYLDGVAIAAMPTRELARQLGILPQTPVAPEELTVRELVAQGRYPHQRWFQQWSVEDERVVVEALAMTGMTELADSAVNTLSGGQRQRAWIAMTLAQDTDLLLLDEPTTYLDLAHQIEVLQLLQRLNLEANRTIVMVVHDLNHAARYAQQIVAMLDGQIVSTGTPHEVITAEMIRRVFGVEADIVPDPRSGVPLCIPYTVHGAPQPATTQLRSSAQLIDRGPYVTAMYDESNVSRMVK